MSGTLSPRNSALNQAAACRNGKKRKEKKKNISIWQSKILSPSVPPIVTLNLSHNKIRRPPKHRKFLWEYGVPRFRPVSLGACLELWLILFFFFFSFFPLPFSFLLLPFILPRSSCFFFLSPSAPSIPSLSLGELLIMKIWSLVGLWSQSLIFKAGNCVVYTKLNLLAFYFCGIWCLNGAAFYLL